MTSTFNVEIGPTTGAIHVCLPYASLEPIRDLLSTSRAAGDAGPDERWLRVLKQQLRHAEVELSAPLARLTTQTAHLMKLKVGDVIAMDIPEHVHAEIEQLSCGKGAPAAQHDIELILDIPVQLTVELGRTRVPIKQVLSLAQGSVIELDGLAGKPMDVLVNSGLIAQGEVVVNEKSASV